MDISQIGASAAVVLTVVAFLKFMREESNKRDESIKRLSTAVDKHTIAAETQTKASKEVLAFMQNLNGKLSKATIATAKENK